MSLDRPVFTHVVLGPIGSATNHVVDASDEGIAFAFQPVSNEAITHLGFRYGARTGTPPTFSVSLETLDSSGLPSGTDVGGGSPTLETFTPPASTAWDGAFQWVDLTNPYTPVRGDVLAVVIRYSSGTIDGSNNSSFTRNYTTYTNIVGFPYPITNTAGAWAKSSTSPVFGWQTSSGRNGFPVQASYTTATAATSGHRSLMKFSLPSGEGSSYRVAGIRGAVRPSAAGGSYKLVLLDASGTVLQETTFDGDQDASVASISSRELFFNESSLTSLSYGTSYYVGVEHVSGGTGVYVGGIRVTGADDREAYPGGMSRCLGTSSGGAITDDNTVIPSIDLIIDTITAASGGGGSIVIGS